MYHAKNSALFVGLFAIAKPRNSKKVEIAEDVLLTQNISVPMALPPIAVPKIAGIQPFIRYVHEGGDIRHGDKPFAEKISFSDSTFFEMFDFPLLMGKHRAFKDKHSIFLREKLWEYSP